MVHGTSKHLSGRVDDYDYNEKNNGFGIELEENRNKVIRAIEAGGFENSYGDTSFYVGGKLAKRMGDKVYIDVGAKTGLVSGYSNGKPKPYVGGLVSVGVKDFVKFNLMYTPKYKKDPAVLMMNLGIPFK